MRYQKIGATYEEDKYRRRCGIGFLILFIIGTITGLILLGVLLSNRIHASNRQITELKMRTMHLETDVMDLMMMQNLQFETRFVQNGTVAFGVPIINGGAVQTVADYSDYVYLNYTLKEIFLTPAGIPQTILEISPTPRPVEFQLSNYNPPVTQPKYNEIVMQLAVFSPGINSLDVVSQNFDIIPYSHVTASKIALSPDCVASNECQPESAFSPFFSGSVPTFNAVDIFPSNTGVPGTAVLQLIWGQNTYASLGAQYDFSGTTISITDTIQLVLPVL